MTKRGISSIETEECAAQLGQAPGLVCKMCGASAYELPGMPYNAIRFGHVLQEYNNHYYCPQHLPSAIYTTVPDAILSRQQYYTWAQNTRLRYLGRWERQDILLKAQQTEDEEVLL